MERGILKTNRPRKYRRSFGASLIAAPVSTRHANRRGLLGEPPGLEARSRRLLTLKRIYKLDRFRFCGQKRRPRRVSLAATTQKPQKLANLIPTPQLQPIGNAAGSCLHAPTHLQARRGFFLTGSSTRVKLPNRPRSTEPASQHTSATAVIFTLGFRNAGNERLRRAGRRHA
jgi:hypothetical protein